MASGGLCTDITTRGYLPIALPAENNNLDEYFRGKCDLRGFFREKSTVFFLKITNRAGLSVHENYEI